MDLTSWRSEIGVFSYSTRCLQSVVLCVLPLAVQRIKSILCLKLKPNCVLNCWWGIWFATWNSTGKSVDRKSNKNKNVAGHKHCCIQWLWDLDKNKSIVEMGSIPFPPFPTFSLDVRRHGSLLCCLHNTKTLVSQNWN